MKFGEKINFLNFIVAKFNENLAFVQVFIRSY